MILDNKLVYVAGSTGMVGSAIVRRLESENCDVVTSDKSIVNLAEQRSVNMFIGDVRPDIIIDAAAKVGGIHANATQPAEFIHQNLMIQTNLIHAAHVYKVKKFLFLGSSCIYPKHADQPMSENALLTGELEPTNEAYAIAKIAGIKMCQAYRKQYGDDFISAMPTNLYGPGDRYDLINGHVPAALIMKIHEAKIKGLDKVEIWGSGKARREFLFVDDMADACVFLLKNYTGHNQINVGTGQDVTIAEFADVVAKVIGYHGKFIYDLTKPDGPSRKLLNVSTLTNMGWTFKTSLLDGLTQAYNNYLSISK